MQNSAFATASNPNNIKVKFYLNKDDPMLKQYDVIDAEIGVDRSTVMSWNVLAEKERSRMYMLVGDDAEFITTGWDRKFLQQYKKYPDGIFMIGTATGKKHGMIQCPMCDGIKLRFSKITTKNNKMTDQRLTKTTS